MRLNQHLKENKFVNQVLVVTKKVKSYWLCVIVVKADDRVNSAR